MKTRLLILFSMAILLIAPSCKKQNGKWTKHVVTEEYKYIDTSDEIITEETPKLCNWKARKLVKSALKEAKIINSPIVVPIKTGYYECNDKEERENLYKAKINGLLNVTYSEIKDKYDDPTYWVEVSLTPEGEKLIVEEENDNIFPEDTINHEYMLSVISPNSGRNQYGEYTFDKNVDSTIIKLVQDFYNAYVQNKEAAIDKYGTQDLIEAQARITTAKELGINRITRDPFLRNDQTDTASIETITTVKWTDYVDLYIVNIDEQEYCIVIKDENNTKKIDDIALNAPNYLRNNKTLRCVALDISARELHYAQVKKDKADAAKAKRAESKKTTKKTIKKVVIEEVEEEIEEESLYYDEYNPLLQPGIVEVERTEPTLYELAKERENIVVVNLLAGDYKFKKIGRIKDVKPGKYDTPAKTAVVVIERTKVSPLGRIFYDMKNGEKESNEIVFIYENEEWVCPIE